MQQTRICEKLEKPVAWNFTTMPVQKSGKTVLAAIFLKYAQGTGEWDDVVTAFVDGWAKVIKQQQNECRISNKICQRSVAERFAHPAFLKKGKSYG